MPTPTSYADRLKNIADLMASFDPNDPRVGKNYMWATFKPGRRGGGFKMHMGRGPALNACSMESNYILYEWDKECSRWRETTRIEERHKHKVCANCKKDVSADPNSYRRRLSWMWVALPVLREVGFCYKCRNSGHLRAMGQASVDKRFFAL